jgi:hypothetical protein
MTDNVTISRECAKQLAAALESSTGCSRQTVEAHQELDAALSSPPSPAMREALEEFRNARTELLALELPDAAWEIITTVFHAANALIEQALGSNRAALAADDGRVKVDEEHPLPLYFDPGDEIMGVAGRGCWIVTAYRRAQKPSPEQKE